MMELIPDPPIVLEKASSVKSNRSGNKRRKARRASQKIDPNAPIELQKQQFLTLLGQQLRQSTEFKNQLQLLGQDAIHAWLALTINYMATCLQLMTAERAHFLKCCQCGQQTGVEQSKPHASPTTPRRIEFEQQQLRSKDGKSAGNGSLQRDSGIEESVYLDESMSPPPRTDSEYYRSEDDSTTNSIKRWFKPPLRSIAPSTHLVQKRMRVLSSSEEDNCDAIVPKPIAKPSDNTDIIAQADAVVNKSMLREHVIETKYVTTVFESLSMKDLVEDVNDELHMWVLNDNSSIAVAAEMIWSYPQAKRSKPHEIALKEKILTTLRRNNRRVLDLHVDCNYMESQMDVPILIYPDSNVRELCGPANAECYQGHYAREYRSLLPHGHNDTKLMHESFWSPGVSTKPEPANYLMGRNRRATELKTQFLVALNFVLLKLDSKKKLRRVIDVMHM